MKITYLGHSSFCVETDHALIIMDPWFSTEGAFDAAWFQYPKNHHLASQVQQWLATSHKKKYIYISHEHKDHYDLAFLNALEHRDFTLILADFFHAEIKEELIAQNYQCKNIISLKDKETLRYADGLIVLFVIDMELDADSAILVQSNTGTFLNLNDSKPHDRLQEIVDQYGKIDVFSGQFSGAIWHPTCYQMDEAHYERVCLAKNQSKFSIIAHSLEILKPAVFIPSAGPPCFLDPALFAIQQQPINTYPRAKQLLDYLENYFKDKSCGTRWGEVMPGDVFDVAVGRYTYQVPDRLNDDDFLSYIKNYAQEYQDFFAQRAIEHAKIKPQDVFIQLKEELQLKLSHMHGLQKLIQTKLYVGLTDHPNEMYCVDFQDSLITTTSHIDSPNDFFAMHAPAWQIDKVLQRQISWADFSLTFRAQLQRVPDTYNTLSHAFLTLNHERLAHFCLLYREILFKKERIEVTDNDTVYSVLRFCPHQGGDLACAPVENGVLTCQRHGWQFDLKNGGQCMHNGSSIQAIVVRKDKIKDDT